MASASEVVQSYFAAIGNGNGAAARKLMKDDLYFKGPIDEFHKADDLMQSLEKLAQIVKATQPVKQFVDGDDVCVIYDLETTVAGTNPVVEWHHVQDGKIASIHTYFDARPFAAMSAAHDA